MFLIWTKNIYKLLCKFCPKRLRTKRSLYYHIRKQHQGLKEDKTPICSFCQKAFDSKKILRIHKNKDHQGMIAEGDLVCKFCPGVFKGGNISTHVKFKHPEELSNTLKQSIVDGTMTNCGVCPKTFNTKVIMKKHMENKHAGLM